MMEGEYSPNYSPNTLPPYIIFVTGGAVPFPAPVSPMASRHFHGRSCVSALQAPLLGSLVTCVEDRLKNVPCSIFSNETQKSGPKRTKKLKIDARSVSGACLRPLID